MGNDLVATEAQQTFLQVYLEAGSIDEASKAADLSPSYCRQLLRQPQMQAALERMVSGEIQRGSVLAVSTLLRLVRSARSEKVQLAAAKDLLDRAGWKPGEVHEHRHTHTYQSEGDIIGRLAELSKELGLPQPNALEVEDAEFEEVSERMEKEPTPAPEVEEPDPDELFNDIETDEDWEAPLDDED